MDDNATKDDLQDILTQTEETIRLLCYDIDSETMRMYDIEAQLRESRQRLKEMRAKRQKAISRYQRTMAIRNERESDSLEGLLEFIRERKIER